MGNEGCTQSIALCLCHSFIFILFSSSSMGSPPWQVVLQKLIHCGLSTGSSIFNRSSPFSTLLQSGSTTGASSCQVTCSSMVSSPWAAILARSFLLHGHFMGCRVLQVTSTCSGMCSCMCCSTEVCSKWYTMGSRGTACSTMILSMDREISGAWSNSCPPSLTFVSAVSYKFFLLLFPSSCCAFYFFTCS